MSRLFIILLLACPTSFSQVRITTPRSEFKAYEQIDVRIEDHTSYTVSYCVEFGQTSAKAPTGKAEDIESTPIPFYVQKDNSGRWGTLLIGPDIGSIRQAVVLQAGESQHYPFRLVDRGRMRLVLEYWRGENEDVCRYPKRKKAARSNTFVVN